MVYQPLCDTGIQNGGSNLEFNNVYFLSDEYCAMDETLQVAHLANLWQQKKNIVI